MVARDWKKARAGSLPQAMELCLEFARAHHHRSVDNVADLMGLPNKWRLYKWVEQADLPAFLVYTGSERIQRGGFEALDRIIEVAIECLAKGADVDDQLDALLALAEVAVNGQTLDGRAVPMIPSKIEYDVSADGSVPIGRARLTYEVIYRTSLTDPETRI